MTSRYEEVDLLAAVKRRQRTSLAGTLITTLVLVAAAGGFLLYSVTQIADKQAELSNVAKKLDDAQTELKATQTNINALAKEVEEKSQQVDEASNLVKQIYPLNWGDEKVLFTRFGRASRLLEVIARAQAQNAHWGFGGTLQDGFTSPGFATYVLSTAAGRPVSYESLPLRQGPPHPGDIIRYDPPYTMFYFPDVGPSARNEGFVVGMTPLGVASLTRSFTPKIVDIRETPLSQ